MSDDAIAIYRIVYLLQGSTDWEVNPQELTNLKTAYRVAQAIHDKYLDKEGNSHVRVLILTTPMILQGQVVYDGGVAA